MRRQRITLSYWLQALGVLCLTNLARSEPLSLQDAIGLALRHNPRIQLSEIEAKRADADGLQASLLPNPELEFEVEDIGLNGDDRGSDTAVRTLRVAQTIELGGKRGYRRLMAQLSRQAAEWDADAAKAEVTAAVKISFCELLAAEQRLRLAEDSKQLAEQVRDTVKARVDAGKAPPLELTKANVAFSESQLACGRAMRVFAAARRTLASLWGATPEQGDSLRITGDLELLASPPSVQVLSSRIANNPELAAFATADQLASAELGAERAARIPDLTVTAGVTHSRETGHETAQLAVSLPLPIFDRNQGGIAKAALGKQRVAHQQRLTWIQTERDLVEHHTALVSAYEEASALHLSVLPAANEAFMAAEEGFRQGKSAYLDVLDAQKTLAEVRGQWIDALAEYHRSIAEIERLINGPLHGNGDKE